MIKFLLKRNDIAGVAPALDELMLGELALNTYDGKIYTKINQNGHEAVVEVTGGSDTLSGLSDVIIDETQLNDDDFLKWDSTANGGLGAWVTSSPQTIAIDDLSDVDTTTVAPQIDDVLSFDGNNWVPTIISGGGTPTGLESITENGNTGWALIGDDRLYKGDIGLHAIDFSAADENSSGGGALGNYSVAFGFGSKASGDYSFAEGYLTEASGGYGSHAEGFASKAIGDYSHAEGFSTIAQNANMHAAGRYNVGTATDTIHETGIGYMVSGQITRKNAFEIYTDGRITAPELTTTLIDNDTTGRILTTKEWVQANAGGGTPTGLEKITEGGNTGWRLIGRDPNNYGDIGEQAVDFSYSNQSLNSSNSSAAYGTGAHGAIGNYSVAFGYNTTASGYYSMANGYQSVASGYCSIASGINSTASANYATASGSNIEASGSYSTAIGGYVTASGEYSIAMGYNSKASNYYSHAEGNYAEASGQHSHAEGEYVNAPNDYMYVFGKYNAGRSDTIFEIGNGFDDGEALVRKNIFEIYNDGTVVAPDSTPDLVASRGNQTLVPLSYLFSAEFGNALPTAAGAPGTLYKDSNGFIKVSP